MVIPVRRALPANALSAEENRRQDGVRGVAADAVRADDRQGRGGPRGLARSRPGRPSRTAALRASRAIRPSRPAGTISGSSNGQRQGRPGGRALRHVQQRHAGTRQPRPARLRRRRAEGRRSWSSRRRSAAATSGPARTRKQLPGIVISFYDENRATIGEAGLGPWRGTFDWQSETKRINVPPESPRGRSSASVCSARWAKSRSTTSRLKAVRK